MPTPDLNLTDEQICQTFPRLVQYDGTNFYDGLGTLITLPNTGGGSSSNVYRFNEIPSGSKDGVNVIFVTSQSYTTGTTKVYRNGLRLTIGSNNDYTETGTNNNRITFTRPVFSTDNLLVEYEVLSSGLQTEKVGEIPTGNQNSINTVFTTNQNFIAGSTKLFQNGLRLTRAIDYYETGVNEITFINNPPYTTDNILIDYNINI